MDEITYPGATDGVTAEQVRGGFWLGWPKRRPREAPRAVCRSIVPVKGVGGGAQWIAPFHPQVNHFENRSMYAAAQFRALDAAQHAARGNGNGPGHTAGSGSLTIRVSAN